MPRQPDPHRIDRIIDVARGVAPVAPSDRENREATRLPFEGRIAWIELTSSGDKAPPTLMICHDISAGGIGVTGPRRLTVGARGGILIEKSTGEAVVLGARVVHSHSVGPEEFESGIEFETTAAPAVSLEDFRETGGGLPRIGRARAA